MYAAQEQARINSYNAEYSSVSLSLLLSSEDISPNATILVYKESRPRRCVLRTVPIIPMRGGCPYSTSHSMERTEFFLILTLHLMAFLYTAVLLFPSMSLMISSLPPREARSLLASPDAMSATPPRPALCLLTFNRPSNSSLSTRSEASHQCRINKYAKQPQTQHDTSC
jgi:hypothetical protein